MAKEIVVQIPQGSPLEKMTPAEIEKFVEQATSHLPKAKHAKYAGQLLIQTAINASDVTESPKPDIPIISWRRACRN